MREKRLLRDAKPFPVILGQIHPVLFEIDADVLPEIRELQPGADVIGEKVQLFLAMTVQQQDQPADRVRAATAIVEHLRKIRVAPLDHVLLERGEQVGEKTRRKVKLANRFVQRDENEMKARRAGRRKQLALPIVERGQAFLRRHHVARPFGFFAPGVTLVGQVVGVAREGVDGVDMGLHRLRHEASDRKILVMFACELGAGVVSFSNGHCPRRTFRLVHHGFHRHTSD